MDVVRFDCQSLAEVVAEPRVVLCRERSLEVRIDAINDLGKADSPYAARRQYGFIHCMF